MAGCSEQTAREILSELRALRRTVAAGHAARGLFGVYSGGDLSEAYRFARMVYRLVHAGLPPVGGDER